MMNIVAADGDDLVQAIPNGHLLSTKYGYPTSYLAPTAWGCQQKAVNGTVA